ncbi:MAG: tetratricopeptide repeat protein [Bacteroidota bacterium]
MKHLAGSFLIATLCLTIAKGQSQPTPGAALQRPATSLLGAPLFPPVLPKGQKEKLLQHYLAAKADYDTDPANPDYIIWFGRRAAYLWRYRKAIEIFSKGIEAHPNDPRLYRHRGHRYVTVREFGKAIEDLRKAAELTSVRADEIEPDGQPNAKNIPTGTLKSNIWYHLGLAYYLQGDFTRALDAYRECMKYSTNDDMLCATADWLSMTLRRLDRTEEAADILAKIHENMNIIENFSYHKRLLMYKGILPVDSLLNPGGMNDLDIATQGYGVANWYFYNGKNERARDLFRRITEGSYWAAFGYIAAEAELARTRRKQ